MPTRGLRVLIAKADLAIRHGEQAVGGERDAVDVPTQVRQDGLCALHSRLAVDHPPCGADRLGQRQIGAVLTRQIEKQAAKELRQGMDRHLVGIRAGRHSVRSAETPPAGTKPWTCGW